MTVVAQDQRGLTERSEQAGLLAGAAPAVLGSQQAGDVLDGADSPDTPIIYTAAAAPIVQAIPLVMAAPAGVIDSSVPRSL